MPMTMDEVMSTTRCDVFLIMQVSIDSTSLSSSDSVVSDEKRGNRWMQKTVYSLILVIVADVVPVFPLAKWDIYNVLRKDARIDRAILDYKNTAPAGSADETA